MFLAKLKELLDVPLDLPVYAKVRAEKRLEWFLAKRAEDIIALVEALDKIAKHDATVENGGEGFNEWGEAWCFHHVQEIAEAAISRLDSSEVA
jgi:hypothetical protein